MKEAVIVGNGSAPPAKTLVDRVAKASLVVAADGGANHLQALRIEPDFVVGDMDSISPEARESFEKKSQFCVYPTDKDKMDLELAVEKCLEYEVSEISVFSWQSLEFDYSLCNLWLLSQFEVGMSLIDPQRHGTILSIHQPIVRHPDLKSGQRVSIFPLAAETSLQTKGLRWNLNWQKMSPPLTSQSNESDGTVFECSLSKGLAVVFVSQESA